MAWVRAYACVSQYTASYCMFLRAPWALLDVARGNHNQKGAGTGGPGHMTMTCHGVERIYHSSCGAMYTCSCIVYVYVRAAGLSMYRCVR